MNVTKLEPFGIEVTDIDLKGPRSKDEAAELLHLFNQNYLLVIRGQALSDADHLRVFHDLFPGAALEDETGTGSEVSYVSNVRPDGLFGDVALTFHSDYSFTTNPTNIISLYGYDVDHGSASTEFSNGELALHALPIDLRDYLSDKKVVCATDLISVLAHIPSYNLPDKEDLSGRSHEEIVRAAWPVIMDHPRTGRPLLYVNEQHGHHLLGLPLAEGRKVLERLCGYLYADEHIYRHDWANGDLVLWDNIALAHGRRQTPAGSAKRTLRRVRSGGATLPMMTSLSQRGIDESEKGLTGGNVVSRELQALRADLGRRIRDFRIAKDLTAEELGRSSGIDFSCIQMFELGIWMPSIPELCTVASGLGINPGQLLEGLSLEATASEIAGKP